jgi:hypothetical protein
LKEKTFSKSTSGFPRAWATGLGLGTRDGPEQIRFNIRKLVPGVP